MTLCVGETTAALGQEGPAGWPPTDRSSQRFPNSTLRPCKQEEWEVGLGADKSQERPVFSGKSPPQSEAQTGSQRNSHRVMPTTQQPAGPRGVKAPCPGNLGFPQASGAQASSEPRSHALRCARSLWSGRRCGEKVGRARGSRLGHPPTISLTAAQGLARYVP